MNKKLLLPLIVLGFYMQNAMAYDLYDNCWGYDIISNSDLTVRIVGCRQIMSSGPVNIPSSVTYNGVTFTVTEIGNKGAFNPTYNTNFLHDATTINIPNTITSIGDSAFANCYNVQTINIGSSVTTIGAYAFAGCTHLTSINFNSSTPPSMGTGVFSGTPLYAFVYVPCGTTMSYAQNSQLNQFSHFVEEGAYGTVTLQQTTGGTISLTQEPTCSTPAIVAAVPASPYYDFVSWNDGDTSNPRHLYVIQDTFISAIFSPKTFYIGANVTDTSRGIAIGDSALYGDSATITAYPKQGYVFHRWKNINDNTYKYENPLTVLCEGNNSYTAYFNTAQFTITVQTDGGGTASVDNGTSNTGSFYYLSTARISAIPNEGNRFVMWSDSNVFANRYITVMKDTLLTAFFAPIASLRDTIYDTVYIYDTIVVHDTIYITQEGIGNVNALNAKVYINNGQIVVEGADGNNVSFYDISGRMLATRRDEFTPLLFDVPTSGTYIIKIGNYPARKVVVIR